MDTADSSPAARRLPSDDPAVPPGGLLDLLSVAAVVLDAAGKVVFWSPHAEELFGYTAEEALGRFAAQLMVHEEHWDEVIRLFAEVMESGADWAGAFPIRHKDGSTRLVEFRNMRLLDDLGDAYALGLAADQATVARVERDVALSTRLVSQSPIGLAVLSPDLRYLTVNPALEDIVGLSAAQHLGRPVREVLSFVDTEPVEARLRHVLATGEPVVDRHVVCRPPGDPHHDHVWSVSYYRLEEPGGRVLGTAVSVIDITDRHRAATEAAEARQRLALIAGASASVGTTFDLETTARELADVVVPALADVAAVNLLDIVLPHPTGPPADRSGFRVLSVTTPAQVDGKGESPSCVVTCGEDSPITRCVRTRRPVLVAHSTSADLPGIAPHREAASPLTTSGTHSYLAVPLVAHGEALGVLELGRTHHPDPFDQDDVILAGELAGRAAVTIDNARGYQAQRHAALTLQRSLLPELPSHLPGLKVACRYEPAGAASEIGGDWFDAIPLHGDKTALVVGDVMGSGIGAAATMGQLRSAARAFAELDLPPAEALRHLDHLTESIGQAITTCIYCVHDPHRSECCISVAGHLPPAFMHPGCPARLLDLPTGVPLGVGEIGFDAATIPFQPGDRLALYTDGLVETRSDSIDARLDVLLEAFTGTYDRELEESCDLLLEILRPPHGEDDVALLIAQVQP
jgi:PAS domain S-box-containing protein